VNKEFMISCNYNKCNLSYFETLVSHVLLHRNNRADKRTILTPAACSPRILYPREKKLTRIQGIKSIDENLSVFQQNNPVFRVKKRQLRFSPVPQKVFILMNNRNCGKPQNSGEARQ